MKRAFLIFLGVILLIVGLAGVAGGTAAAVVVGTDGSYSTDAGSVNGSGHALLFNDFKVDAGGYSDQVGRVATFTTGATSASGQRLFIGLGPAAAVNDYLANVSRDVVSDLRGTSARVVPIPGTTDPKLPELQPFWISKAVGTSPSIPVEARPGTMLVIMNADGSAPVAATLRIGVESTALFPASIAVAVVGAILALLAVWCFIGARRAKRRKAMTAAPVQPLLPPPPPGPYQPQQPYQQPQYQQQPYSEQSQYQQPVPVFVPSPGPQDPQQPIGPTPGQRPSAGGDGPPPASPTPGSGQ